MFSDNCLEIPTLSAVFREHLKEIFAEVVAGDPLAKAWLVSDSLELKQLHFFPLSSFVTSATSRPLSRRRTGVGCAAGFDQCSHSFVPRLYITVDVVIQIVVGIVRDYMPTHGYNQLTNWPQTFCI